MVVDDGEAAAVFTDRCRIADEMRANALRRLVSLGLEATSLRCRMSDEHLGGRLDDLISGLDQTITELRTAIFGLDGVDDPRDRLSRDTEARSLGDDTPPVTWNLFSAEPPRHDHLPSIGTVFDGPRSDGPTSGITAGRQ